MKTLSCLILLFISVVTFPRSPGFTTDTMRMNSVVLNESRRVVIYKPLNLSDRKQVRFMYMLDDELAGYRYQDLLNRFADTLSDVIAVGIVNTDRRRDLLYIYSADKFLDFITLELIPLIEKEYKTESRILFGHSFAGSFTLYALLNRPGCFDAYIVSSPTPIMKLVDQKSYCKADSVCKSNVTLSISCGSKDLKQVIKWALILKNNLSALELKKLQWTFTLFEGKNHGNSDMDALIYGFDRINRVYEH